MASRKGDFKAPAQAVLWKLFSERTPDYSGEALESLETLCLF